MEQEVPGIKDKLVKGTNGADENKVQGANLT